MENDHHHSGHMQYKVVPLHPYLGLHIDLQDEVRPTSNEPSDEKARKSGWRPLAHKDHATTTGGPEVATRSLCSRRLTSTLCMERPSGDVRRRKGRRPTSVQAEAVHRRDCLRVIQRGRPQRSPTTRRT
ncbi:unnamed protein product [Trichogramma brassicae]|uniref:Uncharacterized protein n=1 Tax=Trichogramma brassicae TaxID=86971 RepID=A0A6H5J6D8_9HYME|nr:unnamed protein product [Trichogramma brassicae]